MTLQIISQHHLKPYGFQHKAFQFIHYHGACYLMLDMGMGKTRICIEFGKTTEYPLFVLAPKFAAIETWPAEFRKWDPSAKIAVLHGKNKENIWANTDKYTNIILNYDGLKWFRDITNKGIRPLQRYAFIFDEMSMLKNYDTTRWMIAQDMMNIASPYKVGLSGTPAPQSLEDLWAQYFLLDGGRSLCPDYYQFRNRFFDYTGPDGDPPYQTTIKDWAPDRIHELVRPITMRLAAEDYLDLPEVVYNPIEVTLPSGLRRQYQELENEFMLEFPNATVIANSEAVKTHKLRQFLQGAMYATDLRQEGSRHRLPTVVQPVHDLKAAVVKQLLETSVGRPMLIAIQFKFEIGILERVLKRRIPHITGATSGSEGKRLIQEWNAGRLPFLVVHPKSVAYSLNLQHGGRDLVFSALPWELDLYQQLLKRLVRPGQKHNRVVIHLITIRGTKDGQVAAALRRKGTTQQQLFTAVSRRSV